MKTMTFMRWTVITGAVLMLAVAGRAAPAEAAAKPATKQATFATPEAAVAALIAASEPFDTAALSEILGTDGVDLVSTGDRVQDKSQSAAFFAKAREHNEIARNPKDPNVATLLVGTDAWPMPVPLVQEEGKWRFDSVAGREEILYRRIGENELCAIQVCLGYVEAQHDYAAQKRDGARVNQYAQHVISTPGKQDGLAWQNPDGSWGGPIGEKIARAIEQGYTSRSEPYHGYFFKILKGQGPAAPLGEMEFVVKGVMIGGFALVAAPAEYAVTGVRTFIVSHDGVVYDKDFGQKTLNEFKNMERFNPDKSWTPVPEQDE